MYLQVLLFYPDGKKSSSTEGHLAPPGLPAPGNGAGNHQGGGQGQVLHLPIPPGPNPGNVNGTSLLCTHVIFAVHGYLLMLIAYLNPLLQAMDPGHNALKAG